MSRDITLVRARGLEPPPPKGPGPKPGASANSATPARPTIYQAGFLRFTRTLCPAGYSRRNARIDPIRAHGGHLRNRVLIADGPEGTPAAEAGRARTPPSVPGTSPR